MSTVLIDKLAPPLSPEWESDTAGRGREDTLGLWGLYAYIEGSICIYICVETRERERETE